MTKVSIYVAGPYSVKQSFLRPYSDEEIEEHLHNAPKEVNHNVEKAIDTAIALIHKGWYPYIPHMSHYIHLRTPEPLPKEYYYEADYVWLEKCDHFFLIAKSPGADKELRWFIENKPKGLIFTKLDQVPDLHNLEPRLYEPIFGKPFVQ